VGIHFTRLVFANGYSVSLDANSTQAEDFAPRIGAPGAELASLTPPAGSMGSLRKPRRLCRRCRRLDRQWERLSVRCLAAQRH